MGDINNNYRQSADSHFYLVNNRRYPNVKTSSWVIPRVCFVRNDFIIVLYCTAIYREYKHNKTGSFRSVEDCDLFLRSSLWKPPKTNSQQSKSRMHTSWRVICMSNTWFDHRLCHVSYLSFVCENITYYILNDKYADVHLTHLPLDNMISAPMLTRFPDAYIRHGGGGGGELVGVGCELDICSLVTSHGMAARQWSTMFRIMICRLFFAKTQCVKSAVQWCTKRPIPINRFLIRSGSVCVNWNDWY